MNVVSAIITSPRPVSYLNRTAGSLRSAGIEPMGIFRDHASVMGSFRTFRRALSDLTRQCREADAFAIFEDDVMVARGLSGWLSGLRWPSDTVGALSLYCPPIYSSGEIGFQEMDVVKSRKPSEASCAIVFPALAAREFVEHSSWNKRYGTGFAIGEWCRDSNRSYWMHQPSLVSHIGAVSSIREGGESSRRREAVFCSNVANLR